MKTYSTLPSISAAITSRLFLICLPIVCFGQLPEPVRFDGVTMGTTYHVAYFDKQDRDFKISVDSLLRIINHAISPYEGDSEISTFNSSKKGIGVASVHFQNVIQASIRIARLSAGAFDPTVMPLVNAWGFGPHQPSVPNAIQVDSILKFVGYKKVILSADSVKKNDPRVQLDFGGIGQGYGADQIAQLLTTRGIKNFLVELGGEGICAGQNLQRNEPWTIGILDPTSTRDNQYYKAYARLTDKAFTTSGNYFNYKVIDGKRFGHSINPLTGYPVQHKLLSVSIFSNDCTSADAWATAFMVMGFERALECLRNNPDLDALMIYTKEHGASEVYVTSRMKNSIIIEQD